MSNRNYYLNLAKSGISFPIGTDLVLKEYADHTAILHDGKRLGKVITEAAERFNTPLAIPVMDLLLEKAMMLRMMEGITEAEIPTWHFSSCPTEKQIAEIRCGIESPLNDRMQAGVDAVRFIAEETDRVPVGMSIGPFSLMTKLLADPITPVYLAGTGLTGEDDADVKTVETLLQLTTGAVLRYFKAQAAAGARLFFVAEPAANKVYISPNQMAAGSDVFDRMFLKYFRRFKSAMDDAGVDLFFHCCGELTDEMVKGFASLRPVIMSLGSSRLLWQDAEFIPKDIVLYGNLPSKKFYSDELIPLCDVEKLCSEYQAKMDSAGHPYILGTECDVLCVDGCQKTLLSKAMTIAKHKQCACNK
jgi:uroporphyrinogen-III decarboxylase